ncbi:hypothetical protein BGX27_001251 [Mortierella sp. AM989]|nr:hypothetical protein BGX27_001251 [Mortierella sp. AM989]
MLSAGATVGIVIGSIVFLIACGGASYYFREYLIPKTASAMGQEAREQTQQIVVDPNVLPSYVDHELDPVCVYEHELPPDVVAPVYPILVHSTDIIIPPEDDPLVATTPSIRRGISSINLPEASSSTLSVEVMESINNATPDATDVREFPEAPGTDETQDAVSHYATSLTSIRPNHQSSSTSLSTPSIRASSPLSIASSPRLIDQNMLNMARLASPPSYGTSNRVIARSPLSRPHSHQHTRSATDARQFMLSPTPQRPSPQEDYFGHVNNRARSHTFSHPEPFQSHAAQQSQDPELPSTPRYSLEFPSNVPHEHHLEEHRRARDQYAVWETSLYTDDEQTPGSHHTQPFSQTYSPALTPTSLLTPNTRDAVFRSGSPASTGQTRGRASARPRASTIGESSKLLIQKVQQALWRKSPQIPREGIFDPRFENSSTPNIHHNEQEEMGSSSVVGLGIELHETEAESSDAVVIAIEPEQEREGESSGSSTSSLISSSSEQREEVQEGSTAISMHPTGLSISRTSPTEVMDVSIPTISIPLAAS